MWSHILTFSVLPETDILQDTKKQSYKNVVKWKFSPALPDAGLQSGKQKKINATAWNQAIKRKITNFISITGMVWHALCIIRGNPERVRQCDDNEKSGPIWGYL